MTKKIKSFFIFFSIALLSFDRKTFGAFKIGGKLEESWRKVGGGKAGGRKSKGFRKVRSNTFI